MVSQVSAVDHEAAVGADFLTALAARDFVGLQACFQPDIRFHALVPSGLREGVNAAEATAWLRKWFGDADEFHMLASSVDQIADRLHITYRFRLRERLDWKLIEQHAYCTVDEGLIGVMNVLCSGFRPEGQYQYQYKQEQSAMNGVSGQAEFGADAYYDAGPRGCAEGPLDEITRLMRGLAPGQTLEVRATDPSVARDLPAWCRLVGHDLVKHERDHFLIRHK